jgi:hypothetical protein
LKTATRYIPKTPRAKGRSYRWLAAQRGIREAPFLVWERKSCGQPNCRCARGLRHGPYAYLRWQEWAPGSDAPRYRREYVARHDVRRVRWWIRRHRARAAEGRCFMALLRALALRETRAAVPQGRPR